MCTKNETIFFNILDKQKRTLYNRKKNTERRMEKLINNKYSRFAFNMRRSFIGTNLIILYHSVMQPPYYNPRQPDPRWNELSFAYFVVKGSLKFRIGKKEVIVKENEVVFGETTPDCILLDNGEDAEFYSFFFQVFNYSLPLYKPFSVPKGEAEKNSVNRIFDCFNTQTDINVGSANAVFNDMLFCWLRNADVHENGKLPHGNLMREAQLYINDHIEEKLSVATLAAQFTFAEQYFRKLFTTAVGCSPKKYIETTKIERAFTLLTETSLSVSEIADRLHFSNCHHLANRFKKMYNISPSKCRKTTEEE